MYTDLPERLEKFIDPEPNGGCWLWIGAHNYLGYGHVNWQGVTRGAHRVIYELLRGPIDKSLDIDHLCRVRCCVNPTHLEAVTTRENIMRGENFVARFPGRTHCDQGHEFTPENTHVRSDGGRRCRICYRAIDRKRRARERALVA